MELPNYAKYDGGHLQNLKGGARSQISKNKMQLCFTRSRTGANIRPCKNRYRAKSSENSSEVKSSAMESPGMDSPSARKSSARFLPTDISLPGIDRRLVKKVYEKASPIRDKVKCDVEENTHNQHV